MTITSIWATGTNGVRFLQEEPYAYGPAQPHFTDVSLIFTDGTVTDGVLWVDVDDNVSITGRRARPADGWANVQRYVTPDGLAAATVRELFRDIEEAERGVAGLGWQATASV